jgi:glycerophosphoryl diester phosphodiesterase
MTETASRPSLTAHSGCLGSLPNSLESFKLALSFPVDYLEADCRFSPDGKAYLSHDALPEGERELAMGLDSLLDLASAHPSVRLNLDLKEFSHIAGLAELIEGRGLRERVVLTGVELDSIPAVRASCGGLPYFLNAFPSLRERCSPYWARALAATIGALGAVGLNTHLSFASRSLARALSAAGLSFSVWTVDREKDLRRFFRMPVDNITTRRIDLALALRAELGGGKPLGEGR